MRAEVVDDAGDGPPVVYLPGIGGTGALMYPCAVRLRESFRVVRLCYRGGGENTYPALANSVARLLADRGIERAVFLAESFGGGVAFHLALAHPERVHGLAIVNSFARYPWRGRLWLGSCAGRFGSRAYGWLRRRVGVRKMLGPRHEPELAALIHARRPQFDAPYRARIRMVARLDVRRDLGAVRQPVALFASDQDRIVPSLACAAELESLLPNVSRRVLADCGHLVLPLADLDWPAWIAELWDRGEAVNTRPTGARLSRRS